MYKITDIKLLLSTLLNVIFFSTMLYIIILVIIIFNVNFSVKSLIIYSSIYTVLFFIYFIRVWITYNSGYQINSSSNTFSFPATDIENSILEFVTFKKYRDFANRKCISFDDISNIFIDTKKIKFSSIFTNKTTKTIYSINIVGKHGSNNLNFSSRQKRDEVRGILKEISPNIKDRKIAEFS